MANSYDLVIRGGTVADGSGGALFEADVAIQGTRIAEIGKIAGSGAAEIDAKGLLVTPGFVDIHTHFDGQVTWEDRLVPSSGHGVTSVLMGNCGVGFAPCRPDQHELLVKVMEGVEDIPEAVMAEGLPWNWETFGQYLDVLGGRRCDIDFAAYIPHSPVRVYVMGERGVAREPATDADLAQMRAIVRDAVLAGAMGVSSSHHTGHRDADGALAPSVGSHERELLALADGLGDAGRGVFQWIGNSHYGSDPAHEVGIMREIARRTGRMVTFTLIQKAGRPDLPWEVLKLVEAARRDGLPIRPQVFPRPIGVLLGLDFNHHPFRYHPSFQKLVDLPLAEKVKALRDPELRAKLLQEKPDHPNPVLVSFACTPAETYVLGDPPNYEPGPEDKVGARAARLGVSAWELAYDLLLENDGRTVLMMPPSNYVEANLEAVRRMMTHPDTLIALGDGGAHYGMICDSSFPTFLLSHWVRDRKQGRVPVEWAVKALTHSNASAVGFTDRGLLKAGMKADLNVIDLSALKLHAPRAKYDLPAGGRRLSQKADGYRATIVAGQTTYRDGEATGVLPGRLVRSMVQE